MPDYDYDLIVIGAGSGGVRAARMAALAGARVAIAEQYRVGGTCVIRGCVPKKLFVYAGQLGEAIEDAEGFGWRVTGRSFDWPTLLTNKDREIDRLNGVYIRNLKAAGVELIMERAVLDNAHLARFTGSGRVASAATILIATGARPVVPGIPGREHVVTSNEAFHLTELPRSMAIIGGGYIAVEFACIFHGLGVEVNLIYRGEQILRGFDHDLRDGLAEAMRKKGIAVRVETDVVAVEKTAAGFDLLCGGGERLRAGLVMVATGRAPNTAGLGLESAGVALGARGRVQVDDYSRSSAGHIYAVGDVTDRVNLTPVAIDEAMRFVETAFKDNPTPVDHATIPTAVFSQPEIGTVGLSEAQARERFAQIDIYKSRFRPMKHTLSGRDEQMLMKLVVDGARGTVLGCHIIGPDAADMVQLLAIPLRLGATKADFDATMALHPSAAEELVTMREKWQPAGEA